ncbi:MAG: ATP-binding cassette domain-containing protein, partial [Burkholderiales bacterium]
ERISERVRRFNMKAVIAASANVPLTQIAASFAVALITYLAFDQASRNETTVGGFVAFLGAMLMLLAPLKRLTNVSQSLQRGLAGAESVFALIDQQREVDDGKQMLERARGQIEFRDVRFQYQGVEREALAGVALLIQAGESVALVGASGSGKTTMANLVPRFYTPSAGSILLDGIDVRALTLTSLRANIALVSQDVVLFNDTLAANIAYGRPAQASRDEIMAAARAAHALDFIEAMPQGLDTQIGENGVRLSGGQRQRLAIARAFLKNAPILILDEATSALDTESERAVQSALEELMVGRTTIVIAHRLSTIERADRIVVMQAGRIAEMGRHAELIDRGGVYSRLHGLDATPAPSAVAS